MTGHPAARAEAVSPPATENASGEVAGTEDRHRTEGRVAEPQVRARHGLAVGNGVIDPKVRPFAGARHVGEELELPDCAGPLALDAAARQPGLGARALDQFGADLHDVRRDGFQEARPLLEAGFAVGLKRRPGQRAGPLHIGGPGKREGGLQQFARGGIDRAERSVAARHPLRADQNR